MGRLFGEVWAEGTLELVEVAAGRMPESARRLELWQEALGLVDCCFLYFETERVSPLSVFLDVRL